MELDPVSLSSLYRWIDTIPLDRPKKNIARDFSDGVLMSQVLYYFFPKLVELHNYSASNSLDQKNYNWKTLNQKVFKKMGFMISPVDIDAVVQCKKHAIERILLLIQAKIGEYQQQLANEAAAPSHTKLPPAQQSPQQQQQQQQQPYQQPAPAAAAAASKKSTKSQSSSQHRQSSSPTRSNPSKAVPSQSSSQYPPQSHSQPSQQQPSQPSLSLPSLPNGKLNGDKDATIHDLRETVDILQLKVQKLEQLLRLKNSKIESLQKRLVEVTGQPM